MLSTLIYFKLEPYDDNAPDEIPGAIEPQTRDNAVPSVAKNGSENDNEKSPGGEQCVHCKAPSVNNTQPNDDGVGDPSPGSDKSSGGYVLLSFSLHEADLFTT